MSSYSDWYKGAFTLGVKDFSIKSRNTKLVV